MEDIMSLIGALLMIAIMAVMYVLVVQLVNDPACLSLEKSSALGKQFIQIVFLC